MYILFRAWFTNFPVRLFLIKRLRQFSPWPRRQWSSPISLGAVVIVNIREVQARILFWLVEPIDHLQGTNTSAWIGIDQMIVSEWAIYVSGQGTSQSIIDCVLYVSIAYSRNLTKFTRATTGEKNVRVTSHRQITAGIPRSLSWQNPPRPTLSSPHLTDQTSPASSLYRPHSSRGPREIAVLCHT